MAESKSYSKKLLINEMNLDIFLSRKLDLIKKRMNSCTIFIFFKYLFKKYCNFFVIVSNNVIIILDIINININSFKYVLETFIFSLHLIIVLYRVKFLLFLLFSN